jgi:hypothetical protein
MKEKGIIGDYLDFIAKHSLIYLLRKRGYDFMLSFLNLEVPAMEGFDSTMWKILAEDRKLYSHIGRDIGGPSRLGDVLMSDIQAKITLLN